MGFVYACHAARAIVSRECTADVFSPDLLASMLEVLPAEAFRAHLPTINRHVAWLEGHIVEESLPGGTRGARLRGWRSNHLPPEGGPLGWCTAQVLRCVSRVQQLSRALLVADVLEELGGVRASRPDFSAWARLLDSDLLPASGPSTASDSGGGGGGGGATDSGGGGGAGQLPVPTLKAVLERRMLEPLDALSNSDPLRRRQMPLGAPAGGATGEGADVVTTASPPPQASLEAAASYSAILFGPPGTAKTTVVAAIAKRLGWGLVTVDTR